MEFEYLTDTARLRLRALTPEVYRYVFTHCDEAAQLAFFGLDSKQALDVERAKNAGGLQTYRTTIRYFHLIDKETGRTLGGCGFHNWFREHRKAELGYGLNRPSDRGSGLMSEALAAVLAEGFGPMGLNRIEAFTGLDNEPSLRLLRRAGFTQEGILLDHWNDGGTLVDSVLYRLLRREYNPT